MMTLTRGLLALQNQKDGRPPHNQRSLSHRRLITLAGLSCRACGRNLSLDSRLLYAVMAH